MITSNHFFLVFIITTFAPKLCGQEDPIDLEPVVYHREQEFPQEHQKDHIKPKPHHWPLAPKVQVTRKQLYEMFYKKEFSLIYDQRKCKDWTVKEFRRAAIVARKYINKVWLFDQWDLYKIPQYREFLKTIDDYEGRLVRAYDKLEEKHNHPGNWHNTGLCHLNYIASECSSIRSKREREEAYKKARKKYEDDIKSGYQEYARELDENIDDYYDGLDLYDDCDSQSDRFERRMQAIFADEALLHFEHKEYCLSDDVKQKLRQHQESPYEYEHCYGSALQQTIHQECIDIVDRAIHLSNDHPAYEYKDALIDLADGARELNKAGKTEKAMSVADACWGILDCCSAVIEGAVEGAIGAVVDIYNNPLQTVASLTIGNYVMAYQALKIATNLADIGITSLFDAQAGREKWDDYVAPITNVITAVGTAFANNEISLRDAIKQGTKLVVQYKTQGKILGGLGKFYSTVKTKAVNYIEKNPFATPQMYMTTPEGVMFKAVDESFCATQRAAQSGQLAGGAIQSGQSAWVNKKQLRMAARAAEKELRKEGKRSIRGQIKKAELPTEGKIRYIPPKGMKPGERLPVKKMDNGDTGYIDRFKNVWVKGETRTLGGRGHEFEPKEWDVQLSPQGVQQCGWMTRDNTHLNVSFKGRVTHK